MARGCTGSGRATVASAVLGALAATCALALASCGAPGALLARGGAEPVRAANSGQPTASDLDFLVGGWRFEGGGVLTTWQVWRRTENGFQCAAWQAARGVSRQTERLDLVLTLDGWRLSAVLLDDYEREYPSEVLALSAWGPDWVRFADPRDAAARSLEYRREADGGLVVVTLSSSGGGAPLEIERRALPMVD
jgi:hypothetical protein